MRSSTDLDIAKLVKWNRLVIDATGIARAVDDELQESPRFPKNVSARPIDHQSIKTGLNRRHLRRDFLS